MGLQRQYGYRQRAARRIYRRAPPDVPRLLAKRLLAAGGALRVGLRGGQGVARLRDPRVHRVVVYHPHVRGRLQERGDDGGADGLAHLLLPHFHGTQPTVTVNSYCHKS